MKDDEFTQQKEIAFYAANVDAWFATALEHDKSVLALSTAGIGLLLTLLTTVGVSSVCALVMYILALTCFVVALVTVLFVFHRNRSYIEEVVAGNASKNDSLLSHADTTALAAFGLGVAFAAIIGITTAVQSYTTKELSMSNESKPTHSSVRFNDSFNGAANLAPQPASGISTAQPTSSPVASTTQPVHPAAPSSSATSQGSGGSSK